MCFPKTVTHWTQTRVVKVLRINQCLMSPSLSPPAGTEPVLSVPRQSKPSPSHTVLYLIGGSITHFETLCCFILKSEYFNDEPFIIQHKPEKAICY